MKYDLSQLEIGDIMSEKGHSLISYLIQKSFYSESLIRNVFGDVRWKSNNRPSNHNGIYGRYKEKPVIFESIFQGVVATPIEQYINRVKRGQCELIFSRLPSGLTDKQKEKINRFCIESIGRGYDFKSYFSHLWRITLRLPPICAIESESDDWCTELDKKAYEVIGCDIFGDWPTPFTVEKRISQGMLQFVTHWYSE